ncbi:MAG: lanthionine synthetase LanC family protein [Planctomycetota bacterium]
MITLLVAIRLACPQSDAALPAPDLQSLDPVRATVKRAVNWIARQAIASTEHDDTVVFPEAAGKGVQGAQIYGGTAGVLLFLENAAAVLDDARARALADAATNGLLAARSKTASGALTWITRAMPEGATSLYLGDAGIGQAFLTRARLRGDEDALATAVEVADSIIARGKKSDDQLSWDRQVDIIFGAAGTVLFLLDLGEETKEPRFVEAARAAAHWLIQQAVAEPGEDAGRRLLSWRTQMAFGMPYVNFSHGTAGVAYALARVAGAAHDQDCARAAHAGAAWVLEQTIAEGDGMVADARTHQAHHGRLVPRPPEPHGCSCCCTSRPRSSATSTSRSRRRAG